MPRAKSNRHKGFVYESDTLMDSWPWKTGKPGEIVRRSDSKAPSGPVDVKDFTKMVTCLAAWMRDMKAWGENVRDDIIRLEAAVGAAPGEPGDPPPAPRDP